MQKSRIEDILTAMINKGTYNEDPQSRVEELLLEWGGRIVINTILTTDTGEAFCTESNEVLAGAT